MTVRKIGNTFHKYGALYLTEKEMVMKQVVKVYDNIHFCFSNIGSYIIEYLKPNSTLGRYTVKLLFTE